MKKWVYLVVGLILTILSFYILGLMGYKLFYDNPGDILFSTLIYLFLMIIPSLLLGLSYLFVFGKNRINNNTNRSLVCSIISLILFIPSYFLAPYLLYIMAIPMFIGWVFILIAFIFMIVSIFKKN